MHFKEMTSIGTLPIITELVYLSVLVKGQQVRMNVKFVYRCKEDEVSFFHIITTRLNNSFQEIIRTHKIKCLNDPFLWCSLNISTIFKDSAELFSPGQKMMKVSELGDAVI